MDFFSILLDPENGMTLCNIGKGFTIYGDVIQDNGQRAYLRLKARDYLRDGLRPEKKGLYPAARRKFEDIYTELRKNTIEMPDPEELDSYSMGDSKEEIEYRHWVLGNTLFLNPLNDAYPYSIAARDILQFPNIVVKAIDLETTPWRHGLYDQLKQEFVSARYLFYEGIHPENVHFSDRDVALVNSLDYPSYGLATEKLKSAFRSLFSVLDKIAYFLRFYFDLDISEGNVNFSNMWYKKPEKGKPQELSAKITSLENWPLMGLYWLHRDLQFNTDVQGVTEPEMKDIRQIRIYLEHKFLRLRLEGGSNTLEQETPISKSISRRAFENKGLKLLKLIRSALIYTHATVVIEERQRVKRKKGAGKIVAGRVMDMWDDDWKQ